MVVQSDIVLSQSDIVLSQSHRTGSYSYIMHYCNKSLEHNEIRGSGASALADALRVNQSFDYYDNHLTLTQSHTHMLDTLHHLP